MTGRISKTNVDLDFFNRRLDEIRMNGHERLKAKAQLARAEAMADALVAVTGALARFVAGLFAKPAPRHDRAAPHAG